MSKFYVIGVYGYKNCSPLGTEGKSVRDCRHAIAWQNSRGACSTPFHVCEPTDQRGVFASVETGALFATNRGALTVEAYERLLNDIWPV